MSSIYIPALLRYGHYWLVVCYLLIIGTTKLYANGFLNYILITMKRCSKISIGTQIFSLDKGLLDGYTLADQKQYILYFSPECWERHTSYYSRLAGLRQWTCQAITLIHHTYPESFVLPLNYPESFFVNTTLLQL